MANETEQLLSTEQAVQQLLKELETLMKQVGGYDHAKQSLEEVRQGQRGLIERTSSLAEQTQSATATHGKIGTPEILARVDNAKSAVTQSVEATGGRVGGGIEASTKAVVSAIRELAVRSEEARKAQEAETAKQNRELRRLVVIGLVLSGLSLLGTISLVAMSLLAKKI